MKNKFQPIISMAILCLSFFTLSACNETTTTQTNTSKAIRTDDTIAKNSDKPTNTKIYSEMSETEQDKFIGESSELILRKFGIDKSGALNSEALARIKPFVDNYARRIDLPIKEKCGLGDNLSSVLKRGSKVSKDIAEGFSTEKLPIEAGIYLAMIESQFCPCLQSPTGPLGMFQFTRSVAREHGLEVKKDASPNNPDQRCEVKPAALAAAKYIESHAKDISAEKVGVLIAIGEYNGGKDTNFGLSEDLKNNPASQENFWKLLSETKTSKFQSRKFLAKFIAAAIVGENPKKFGVDLLPLSRVN